MQQLQQKPVKKNAFSIENLAISSVNEVKTETPAYPVIQTTPLVNYPVQEISPRSSIVQAFMKPPVRIFLGESKPTESPRQCPSPIRSDPATTPGRKRRFSDLERFSTSTPKDGSSISSSTEFTDRSLSPRSNISDDDLDGGRRKKARTAFSNDQIHKLEKRFQEQKYLAASERTELAEKLKLSDQQVKTWFQNRRMKEKRQQTNKEEQGRLFPFPTGGVDVSQLHAMGLPYPPPSALRNYPPTSLPMSPNTASLPHNSTPNQQSILPEPGHVMRSGLCPPMMSPMMFPGYPMFGMPPAMAPRVGHRPAMPFPMY
ncbi:hypothetical protein SNE40_017653 [Patella caerulea]|uniref:Homeobox domain-containing protein n=1 Tax=Patella caerulea TaxID=87958 RepID=A0AAN8PEG8_PATCE